MARSAPEVNEFQSVAHRKKRCGAEQMMTKLMQTHHSAMQSETQITDRDEHTHSDIGEASNESSWQG